MSRRRMAGRRRPRTRPPGGGGTAARGPLTPTAPRQAASVTVEIHDVSIKSIAAGGDGVARANGRVVFVPRTAPGDEVRVRASSVQGGRFARGAVLEILTPSPDRVAPACTHYTADRCGGCQLQHMRYDAQVSAKAAIVRDALMRIAGRDVAGVSVTPSPRAWRYRRKLTLALRRQSPGAWVAGLHRFDAPNDVFALEDCPITEEPVVTVWREIVAAGALLPDAAALRGSVRWTPSGHVLVLEGGSNWDRAAALAEAVPSLTEIWWTPERGVRRRLALRPRALRDGGGGGGGGDAATIRTGASFAQVNDDVGAALHADVVRRVLAYEPKTAIDAYAGSGATATALAAQGVRVVAIEVDPDALAGCAATLPASSRAEVGRVEDVLPGALPADVVILNPPRAGVSATVLAVLRAASPPSRAIVYVSCDPATLARDVARLAGWRIAAVQAFDMFPQTAHIETLCELVPERRVSGSVSGSVSGNASSEAS